MPRIRVLIVDDSVVIRRIITEALAADPEIEVVGTAADGRIALAKISQVNPDLVTLDVEMPELDGLQTLALLRQVNAALPVIMFSTLTERGASATLEALALGARDYVTKPSNMGSIELTKQRIRDELIPKIKVHCAKILETQHHATSVRPPVTSSQIAVTNNVTPVHPVKLVVIGVSTGGPNALAQMLPVLRPDFPVPILIVQHMPPLFTKLLADRLAAKCCIPVAEAVPGAELHPSQAWFAPGNYHMALTSLNGTVRLNLHQGPLENSCRPAVDVLFRSAAEVYRSGTLAVILTGMGQDGLRGCEAVRSASGQILAQDEATSVVWGMPGFVAKAGLADRILPLHEIGTEINRRVFLHRILPGPKPVGLAASST